MALVKFGAGIVDMRGSIAGVVHARNRFGNYTRPRTKPVNPKSQRQTAIHTVMMYLAEQWGESPMTDAIRTAWIIYANSVNWQNKLGEQVTLTGFNMFIMCNSNRIYGGHSIKTAAPIILGLPAGDPNFEVNTLSAGGADANVVFDDGFAWCSENDAYIDVYQGLPQPASHDFFGGPWRHWFRKIGAVGDPATSPLANQGSLPWTLVEGQKVWFEARIARGDARVTTRFRPDPQIVGA